MEFKMEHKEGRVFLMVTVSGVEYIQDITEYLSGPNAFDDWLDYELGLHLLKEQQE